MNMVFMRGKNNTLARDMEMRLDDLALRFTMIVDGFFGRRAALSVSLQQVRPLKD